MKFLFTLVLVLSGLTLASETSAQTRGPRYNPPGGGSGHIGGRSPSTPRGPSYNPNPGPSRPSTSSSPGSTVGGSTPRGPRYNPNPGQGNGGTYSGPTNPGQTVGGATPRGPRYNPNPGQGNGGYHPGPDHSPVPRGPRYNNPGSTTYRPVRTDYGTPRYHHPYGYSPVRYINYYHSPYSSPYVHTVRYYRTFDWYSWVYRSYPDYVYTNWIFYPATGYVNGYWTIENYPYYVYNGYRYRYSSYDYCNYQLVDQYDHRVVQNYWNQVCNNGYDSCSYERDRLNAQNGEYRFFCSETIRDYGYDYSTPTYEDNYGGQNPDYSNSCNDYNHDGYCDQQSPNNTCYDTNHDGMCDNYNQLPSGTCSDQNRDGYCD
jgi:hypothetical protein